ncbi:MAG TPA: HEAT repeat domain-containing protein [Polyangiaceae bacterium]
MPRNLAAALRDMQSRRAESRRSAIVDLVRYADTDDRQRVVEAMRRSLAQETDPDIRAIAALATADGHLNELIPELVQLLEAAPPRVQQMALVAVGELGERGDPLLLRALRPMLTSELPALRYQALAAWQRLGDDPAQLVRAVADPDAEVRFIAWSMLDEYLAHNTQARASNPFARAADQSGVLGGASEPTLFAELSSHWQTSPKRTRILAAAVLYRLGDAAPLTALLQEVEHVRRWSRTDRLAMVTQCGRLRMRAAFAWLKRLARVGWFEGPCGWPATAALAALDDQVSRDLVLAELRQPALHRKQRALVAVREFELSFASDQVQSMNREGSGIDPWLLHETIEMLAAGAQQH